MLRNNILIMDTFKPTYIYVKTCNHCGLKYFGKSATNRNNVKNIYKGSGKKWVNHYKYHNSKITTFIIKYFNETQKWYILLYPLIEM